MIRKVSLAVKMRGLRNFYDQRFLRYEYGAKRVIFGVFWPKKPCSGDPKACGRAFLKKAYPY